MYTGEGALNTRVDEQDQESQRTSEYGSEYTIHVFTIRPLDLHIPGQRTALPLTQMSFRVASSHSGAEFEAGRLGHRNGEAPNGEDRAEDGREDCVRDCVCASGAVARAAPRRAHARARGISGLATWRVYTS